MNLQIIFYFTCFISVVLLFLVLTFYRKLKLVKRQLLHMQEILTDIQTGNGNRRILLPEKDITAPLAYQMNDIVSGYEDNLIGLKKADETNRQLMTSLSHDVRTPLTTLIGYLDATHRGIVTGHERDAYIETARRKAHDLKDYIDVLFDWFKLNSDEFSLSPEPVELAELTRTILKDWIPVLEEKNLAYEIEIPEKRLLAKIDLDGYSRIINNLIQNVLTHSQASEIKIHVWVTQNKINIDVSDNGVGIAKTDIHHIFERLYKCDKGRSEKGSGLGLSIVKQMTEKMNGSISVSSEQGKQTDFIVKFPLLI